MRDSDLLNSALARPQNAYAYGDADLYECAAAYGFEIAKNHPFVDGNKRTGFAVMLMFLDVNGAGVEVSQAEAYETMIAVTESRLSEADLADWLESNSKPR